MFEPVRGGTRGGQAEFKWSDVSADKDREHYLGHSINAPTGRWQKNKDIHWYSRDLKDDDVQREAEIRKIKDLEAQAIASVLGYEPTMGPGSGSNAIALSSNKDSAEADARRKSKEEKRRQKEEKREERRARKDLKKLSRSVGRDPVDLAEKPRRHPSRSRSPRYRSQERKTLEDGRVRSRSRSPVKSRSDYDAEERERDREKDRLRWDFNARRNQPLDRRRRY